MNPEASYRKRIADYGRILRNAPAHEAAFWDTLRKHSGVEKIPDVRDATFLSVFAPALTEYIKWVLDEAQKTGIRRLYFLARDGYLLYHLASVLAAKRKLNIELRYLKVSRYALRLAEYCLNGETCLDTLCVGGIDVTFAKILKRAALTEEEIQAVAKAAGYEERIDETLSYSEICFLKGVLAQIPKALTLIRKHSLENLDQTIAYLKQEGLVDGASLAIVDSGWVGTTQQSLNNLLSQMTGRTVMLDGFYFGLYELPQNALPDTYHAFYITPDDCRKNRYRKSRFSICMFETVCSAPAGMTVGYHMVPSSETGKNGKYEAIESDLNNPNSDQIKRFQWLIMDYAGEYAHSSFRKRKIGSGTVVEELLCKCMSTPTQKEAESFGTLLFCDDVLELRMEELAVKWGKKDLKKQWLVYRILVKTGRVKDHLPESGWPEGSIVRSTRYTGFLLWQERIYKRMLAVRQARKQI